eukprot:gene20286-20197_t
MLRRLLLVLCLTLGGLTAATPALAQRTEAEVRAVIDNAVVAGQASQDAMTASMELLGLLLDAAGQANVEGIDEVWLADWTVRVDGRVAALEAVLPRLAPMSPAEIQKRSLGYPRYIATFQQMNKLRADLMESSRQAIFFAREAQALAQKAAKGDEQARQRMIRMGVSSNRLTVEAQMAAVEASLATLPDDQPQKRLGEAAQANTRAAVEIYRMLERRLSGGPLDAA